MRDCPEPSRLASFLEEQLAEDERETLASHLDACPHCQATVETLLEDRSPLLAPLANVARPGQDGTPGPGPPGQQGTPLTVPGYEVLEEIGRGGVAVVYRARQIGLDRLVALKLLSAAACSGPQDVARLRREAVTLGQLRHPHIVQILDIGEAAGSPFLVLELVTGPSLAALLQAGPLPPVTAAELLEILALTVQAVHCSDILHRDLKPANVLLQQLATVTPGGSWQCRGAVYLPKLVDFGLARRGGEDGATATGVPLGTPAYMAPEQAGGQGKLADVRTDIYGLGAVLYHALTGRPPFDAGSSLTTVLQVLHEEPVAPSGRSPEVPRDLETICLKCLEKNPARRYATAEELADDLRRFLDGQPVRAQPPTWARRAARWARQHATRVVLLAFLALVFLGTAGLYGWHQHMLARARADVLLQRLLEVPTSDVLECVEQLRPLRGHVLPALHAVLDDAHSPPRERLRAALLLADDRTDAVHELCRQVLLARPPEVALLRTVLQPHRQAARELLWPQLRDARGPPSQRLRAAGVLAAFDPDNPAWAALGPPLAEQLLLEEPLHLRAWARMLRNVRPVLREPLQRAFQDDRAKNLSVQAALVLGELFSDQQDLMLDLLEQAGASQVAALLPQVHLDDAAVARRVDATLQERLPPWTAFWTLAHPRDPESKADALARRQARLALVWLVHGQAERFWPLLRQGPDPRLRTYLVHLLAPARVDPALLLERFEREAEPSVRQALLLALGDYGYESLPHPGRETFVERLRASYENDPDSGVHAAAGWLLRTWKRDDGLAEIDRRLAGAGPREGCRWYVAPHGQTFVVLEGQAEFVTGSPVSEWHRDWGGGCTEEAGRRVLWRRFAVAATEVTVAQFEKMPLAYRRPARPPSSRHTPDPACPVNEIHAVDAMCYCRWLSEQEGIPEEQQCYPPVEKIRAGAGPYPGYMGRKGYRLPTEWEWECAARAGARTRFAYGADEELMAGYDWFVPWTADRAGPVGQLRPNAWGLFDVHGNVAEWCHGLVYAAQAPFVGSVLRDEGSGPEGPFPPRVVRGASFDGGSHARRLARRVNAAHYTPGDTYPTLGFRLARTLGPPVLPVTRGRAEANTVWQVRVTGQGTFQVCDVRGDLTFSLREGPAPATFEVRPEAGDREFSFLLRHVATDQVVRIHYEPRQPRPSVQYLHTNQLGMRFVLLPAGSFLQGAPAAEAAQIRQFLPVEVRSHVGMASPRRTVRLTQPFGLGVYEVTREEFARFVEATGYRTDHEQNPSQQSVAYTAQGPRAGDVPGLSWRDPLYPLEERLPVTVVSWNDAVRFCDWLTATLADGTYRLPTEAEWEYACRAGTDTVFPFGNSRAVHQEYAWFSENTQRPHPVGLKRPNRFGLYDMLGNAMEWCADVFDPEAYRTDPAVDPRGPAPDRAATPARVRRGGEATSPWYDVRPASRFGHPPTVVSNVMGFRVARSPWVPPLEVAVEPVKRTWDAYYRTGQRAGTCVVKDLQGPVSLTRLELRGQTIHVVRALGGPPPWYGFSVQDLAGKETVHVRALPRSAEWTVRYHPWQPVDGDRGRWPTAAEWSALVQSAPVFTEQLHGIKLVWDDTHRPVPVPAEGFGAVATTTVELPAGTYELATLGSAGHRVYLGDVAVIDTWQLPNEHVNRTEVTLPAGKHSLRIEAFHGRGTGKLQCSLRALNFAPRAGARGVSTP